MTILFLNPKTQGADVNIANGKGYLAQDLPILSLIPNQGADVKSTDNDGSTPLWTAADNGHLDIVKYLADKVFAANRMDSRLKFTILSLNPTTPGS